MEIVDPYNIEINARRRGVHYSCLAVQSARVSTKRFTGPLYTNRGYFNFRAALLIYMHAHTLYMVGLLQQNEPVIANMKVYIGQPPDYDLHRLFNINMVMMFSWKVGHFFIKRLCSLFLLSNRLRVPDLIFHTTIWYLLFTFDISYKWLNSLFIISQT